jgi:alpha-amylase
MVGFRNLVQDAPVTNWWESNNGNQIAFCRGNLGFIAMNNAGQDLEQTLQVYCNISFDYNLLKC